MPTFQSTPFSRRDFLKYTAGAYAAAAVAGFGSAASARKIPLGTQLYCVRHELAEDVPKTIAALAEMGYEAVEFADYFDLSAAQWRKLLDAHNLSCCGTHIHLETLLGDELDKTVAFNQILGNRNLILRWLPEECRTSKEELLKTCDTFNEISERLKPHNMRVGYHNHGYIFERFDGEYLWNIIADHTTDDFILQYDTGNAAEVEGVDVVEVLKRNPGRHATMHIKPHSHQDENAFIGADELDWPQIFSLAESMGGIETYIIEYEKPAHPPLEALRANLDIVKGMVRG